MTALTLRHRLILLTLFVFGFAIGSAIAGPPLLVHPYNIGGAVSLPWSGRQGLPDYDRSHLIADTEAILQGSPSAIVHMETLRRAFLYARVDPGLVAALQQRLVHRAALIEQGGKADPLAYLDAAYAIEAVRTLDLLNEMAFERVKPVAELSATSDGYPWITKAIALRSADASLQLAAALIAANRHGDSVARHAELARAGASGDPLLAKNLDHLAH